LGAITTKKKKTDRKAMYSYGENLGVAFQIKDDLLDLLGSEYETGKNKGGDIKRNMITLPLLYAKSNLSGRQNRVLKNLLNQFKKNKNVLDKIVNIIKETGGIDYTMDKLSYFSNQALKVIEPYPNSEFKESMINLVLFNKNRSS
jgi:octaprenyl-diphosphate synthase